jgi:hypothetical protein
MFPKHKQEGHNLSTVASRVNQVKSAYFTLSAANTSPAFLYVVLSAILPLKQVRSAAVNSPGISFLQVSLIIAPVVG